MIVWFGSENQNEDCLLMGSITDTQKMVKHIHLDGTLSVRYAP
jgi:hypothetical protein